MKDTKGKNYQKLCLYIKCSHVVNGLGKQKNIKKLSILFHFMHFYSGKYWMGKKCPLSHLLPHPYHLGLVMDYRRK